MKEQVVALADPNGRNLEAALAKLRKLDPSASVDTTKVKTFRDYREMFDKVSDEIDAVVVATNNNHHALPALMAMRRGIHVYVEKGFYGKISRRQDQFLPPELVS